MYSAIEGAKLLKKHESEVKSLLEKIEECFALCEINQAMYEKFAAKYNEEILKISDRLKRKAFDSSNLDNAVEKWLQIPQNNRKMWFSSAFDEKQKISRHWYFQWYYLLQGKWSSSNRKN